MGVTMAPASGVVAAADSGVRVEVLENWPSVEALEPEWNRLLNRSSTDSIFLTWEWIRCWAAVMGESIRPVVVCVRDARGELIGVAPFYQAILRLGHAIPFRVLRVMADHPTGADYPDWIIQRGGDHAITMAIVQALKARGGWDLIWMAGMAGWTLSFERIVSICRAAGLNTQERSLDFSVFELPSGKDGYFGLLSRNKRQQLRAETKRILERPGVEICRCQTEEDIPAFLDALFVLHGRRWIEKGEAGTFESRPQEVAFFRQFVPVALRKGWLRFYGLREQGEFKAAQIGYVYRNVFHQLQEGFDPTYRKGVGNVLRAKVIEACIEEGVEAYDFLGEMTEHKRRWLAQPRTGHDLMIGRRTLKNGLLFAAGVWPSGRYMHQVSPVVHDAPLAAASPRLIPA